MAAEYFHFSPWYTVIGIEFELVSTQNFFIFKVHYHSKLWVIYVFIYCIFLINLLCLSRLHLLDQKYNKNKLYIVENYYIFKLLFTIFMYFNM